MAKLINLTCDLCKLAGATEGALTDGEPKDSCPACKRALYSIMNDESELLAIAEVAEVVAEMKTLWLEIKARQSTIDSRLAELAAEAQVEIQKRADELVAAEKAKAEEIEAERAEKRRLAEEENARREAEAAELEQQKTAKLEALQKRAEERAEAELKMREDMRLAMAVAEERAAADAVAADARAAEAKERDQLLIATLGRLADRLDRLVPPEER